MSSVSKRKKFSVLSTNEVTNKLVTKKLLMKVNKSQLSSRGQDIAESQPLHSLNSIVGSTNLVIPSGSTSVNKKSKHKSVPSKFALAKNKTSEIKERNFFNSIVTKKLSKISSLINTENGRGSEILSQKVELLFNVMQIRHKIKDDLKSAGTKIPEIKNSILSKWMKVINMLARSDIKLFLESFRILGELYIEFGDYEHAKRILHFLKYICFNLEFPYELSRTYESLATCYKYLSNFKKAITLYKKQIEMSWVLKDYITELRSYDNIGIQYFYLNNKSKARYFHNRMINGKIEKHTSQLRTRFIKEMEEKNERMFYKEDKTLKTDDEDYDNDLLLKKLYDVLLWFDVDKSSKTIEDLDVVKMSDKLNDSSCSATDLTFLVLNDDYDDKLSK